MNTSSNDRRFITLLLPVMLCAAFISGALVHPETLQMVIQSLSSSLHQSRPIPYASSDSIDRSIRRLEWRIKRRERKMFQQMDKITQDIFVTRAKIPCVYKSFREYESVTAEIIKKLYEKLAEIEGQHTNCRPQKRITPRHR